MNGSYQPLIKPGMSLPATYNTLSKKAVKSNDTNARGLF